MVLINKAVAVPGLDGWLLIDFNDGKRKLVDINPHMKGVLEQLKDPEFFKKVFVDKELRTVTWPGELDLDPDSLYLEGKDIKDILSLAKVVQEPSFNDFLESV